MMFMCKRIWNNNECAVFSSIYSSIFSAFQQKLHKKGKDPASPENHSFSLPLGKKIVIVKIFQNYVM